MIRRVTIMLLLASPCMASGPLYRQTDPNLQIEIDNIYKDIRGVPNGTYQKSSMTVQGITVDSVTVRSRAVLSYLNANQCVQTDANGKLTSTGGQCLNIGGSSNLAVYTGSTQVSSPTAVVKFSTMNFQGSLVGGSTASIDLAPAITVTSATVNTTLTFGGNINTLSRFNGLPFIVQAPVVGGALYMGNGAGQSDPNATATNTTAFGSQALASGIGNNNSDTAFGSQSQESVTSGFENTSVGAFTMIFATSAASNDAFGFRSQWHLTRGTNNAGFGEASLQTNTTGSQHTAVGFGALATQDGNAGSTCVGYGCETLQNSQPNTCMGFQCLNNNLVGRLNTCFGYDCLQNDTSDFNTCVGYQCQQLNTLGNQNTAVGTFSLQSNLTASSNTAVGYQTLANATNGPNDAFGYNALAGVTTGSSNTAVGYQAGFTGTAIATGQGNIFLGYNAQGNAANLVNAIAIGHDAIVTGSSVAVIGGAIGAASGVTLKVSKINTGLVDVGSGKITSLANGTTSTDAMTFGQLFYGVQKSSQCTLSANSATTGTSYVNVLSCTIIPTSASNRIKITVTGNVLVADTLVDAFVTLANGSTNLAGANGFSVFNIGAGANQQAPLAISYIDSPATTSAVTYNLQLKGDNSGHSVAISASGTKSVMILEEII